MAAVDPIVVARFWSKVEVAAPHLCWAWQRSKSTSGYGKFKLDGRDLQASRFAWELVKGDIPPGLHVLHRCDNPSCCNPKHLFLGTPKENMADMVQKGRNAGGRGPSTRLAKLTSDQVAEIRSSSETGNELAARFGVAKSTISVIRNGLSRKHG